MDEISRSCESIKIAFSFSQFILSRVFDCGIALFIRFIFVRCARDCCCFLRSYSYTTDYLMIFDIFVLFHRVCLLSHAIGPTQAHSIFSAVANKWGHFHRWVLFSLLFLCDDSFPLAWILSLPFTHTHSRSLNWVVVSRLRAILMRYDECFYVSQNSWAFNSLS